MLLCPDPGRFGFYFSAYSECLLLLGVVNGLTTKKTNECKYKLHPFVSTKEAIKGIDREGEISKEQYVDQKEEQKAKIGMQTRTSDGNECLPSLEGGPILAWIHQARKPLRFLGTTPLLAGTIDLGLLSHGDYQGTDEYNKNKRNGYVSVSQT